MKSTWKRLIILVLALGMVAAACSDETTDTTGAADDGGSDVAQAGDVLAAVLERGELVCGVNDAVPGFGFVDQEGDFVGFDVDYCKAVAAAVFGDANAVEYKPLTAQQRFTALQSGEIDVLIRNTTWTSTRDGAEGATFLHTTFYDGQGIMVRADSGIGSIDDMANTAVCVLSGTTTELNLATRFNGAGIAYEPLTFDANEQLQQAFTSGQCEGWTSDKSQLAGVRSNYPAADGGSEALVILDETFSKEPLGPVVRDGDSQWAQIVDWVVLATIQAEEFGINSGNVSGFGNTEDVGLRRFLGLEITDKDGNVSVFDSGLGLDPGWIVDVISAVGNYGEIFARNIGPETALGLPRGVNSLWTDGGLLYAPPFR